MNQSNTNDIAALDVVWVEIDSIIPYARNPRKHRDMGIDKVAASIKEYGFRQPIVVNSENVIVAGHSRYFAAKRLNMLTVPVHQAIDLSDAQIKAYRIADNRTHEESLWDNELLSLELEELEENGFSLEQTAFDVSQLDEFLSGNHANEDKVDILPSLPIIATVQMGDVWQLGNHRLVCGDATDAACYGALLGASKVNMVYTDPPYNVNYQAKAGSIANDKLSSEQFYLLLQKTFANVVASMKGGAPIYVSYSEKETECFYRVLRESGLLQSSCLIWIKNQLVLGRGDYHCKHEPIWYGWKGGAKHVWHGGRKQTTLANADDILPLSKVGEGQYLLQYANLNVIISGENVKVEVIEDNLLNENKPQRSELHPTMKPIALLERLIKNSSARGEVVLDAFGGSGSTLIACENLNRHARLIELEPKYCDVIIQRWQNLTGKIAINALSGEKYQEQQ